MSGVEVIVDSSQARYRGYWLTSNMQKGSYSSTYRVTDRNQMSMDPRTVQWLPSLPSSGNFSVAIWLPAGSQDRARAVKYRLFHAGSISEFVVDQSQAGGEWKQLGLQPFYFSNSGQEYLELRVADVEATGSGLPLYVQADAVRFASQPLAAGAAPVVTSLVTAANYVEITWNAVSPANSFVVSRAVKDGPMAEIAQLGGTTYLDLDVDGGTTYTYSVAGITGAGVGLAAVVKAETPNGPPLQPVQGVTIRSVKGVPRLTWQPTRDASAYIVQRGRRSGGPFVTVAQVRNPSFFDFSAPQQAFYLVRSVNAHGPCALPSWQVNWRRP